MKRKHFPHTTDAPLLLFPWGPPVAAAPGEAWTSVQLSESAGPLFPSLSEGVQAFLKVGVAIKVLECT